MAFLGDGTSAACVTRAPAARPVVELAAFYPGNKAPTPEALEKIGKDLNANAYRCTTLLGSGQYQVLVVDAPNVPAEELKTAIRWRLKDMLDFHVDDATIDVLDIPVDKSAAAHTHSMFAVAARSNMVAERQNLFARAKVGLSVIDIAEMAQRNISALIEPEGRGVAVLSFDESGGLLTVTFKGELYLARRIDVPLAQLQEPDQAKKQGSFDRITLELQRSLDHFDRQFQFVNVSKLVLAPSTVSGFEEYLSSNLYMPVESMKLAEVLDVSKIPDLQDLAQQQRFFLTLGAALRDEELVP